MERWLAQWLGALTILPEDPSHVYSSVPITVSLGNMTSAPGKRARDTPTLTQTQTDTHSHIHTKFHVDRKPQ